MRYIHQLILTAFLCIASYGQSTDSLLTVLEESQGAERIEVLHDLIIKVWLNYPDQAMGYGEEALNLSREFGDSTDISKSLRLIAGVYYYRGDYDESLDYNIRALNIATALEDSSLMNNGYNNIGLLYYELGSYQTALEYLIRSKQMKDKIGQLYGLSTTLNNMGLVFDRIGNYTQARRYFLEAYDVALEFEDRNEIYALNNIGITYLKEKRVDIAMTYFKQGLAIAEPLGNINWGSVSLRSIGEVFVMKEMLDSALYYCQKSLEASRSIDDKKGIVEVYQVFTKYAIAKGDPQMALAYLEESEKLASQLKLRQHLLDNLRLYIQIYQLTSENERVAQLQNEYIGLRDSLLKDVVSRNLMLVPIKLKEESDRITLAQQQTEIQSKSFTNRLYATILLISVPLVIILIVLLQNNQKAHQELLSYNEELQRTQKLLITSEKMASLGVMAAGIAHEINNPLNFIKNGVEALSKKVKDGETEKQELDPLFKIVNEGVGRASNIVKSLSHFSRKSPDMNESCNIHEIIENCLLILHSKIKDKVRITTDFAKAIKHVKGNEGRLHQAMMNIISNAEQAIPETGNVKITTTQRGKSLEIMIEDDGEGIPEENLSKISDPFFTTKAPGEGTGLGLFITFSIIEEHNGHVDVMSSPEKGTVFIITLPTDGNE